MNWIQRSARAISSSNAARESWSGRPRLRALKKAVTAGGTAQKLLGWEHSGFLVFLGEPIAPHNTESRRRLARYLVKASLSVERMRYDEATCEVRYVGRERRMSALDFLAEVSAVDRGQHLVSQWGRHSNRSRGTRLRAGNESGELAPRVGESPSAPGEGSDPILDRKRKSFRIAWATLLRKVWGPNLMACPRCASPMKIVAAVIKPSVAERILKHLGLFHPPRAPTVHDCPSPPLDARGQALLVFPPRGLVPEHDAPDLLHPEDSDPRLLDDWPVDAPHEDD